MICGPLCVRWSTSNSKSKAIQRLVATAENDLAVIGQQYPFEPLEYQRENLRLPFAEGIKMLQEAGFEVLMRHLLHLWSLPFCMIRISVAHGVATSCSALSFGQQIQCLVFTHIHMHGRLHG